MGLVRVLSFFSDEAVQNVWLGDNIEYGENV